MKKMKVIYTTPFGNDETVISIDKIQNFPKRFKIVDIQEIAAENWIIERVDRYWFYCGRNCKQYDEVTYWYNPSTLERKETKRTDSFFPSEAYKMPEWCKGITEHRRNRDAENY